MQHFIIFKTKIFLLNIIYSPIKLVLITLLFQHITASALTIELKKLYNHWTDHHVALKITNIIEDKK